MQKRLVFVILLAVVTIAAALYFNKHKNGSNGNEITLHGHVDIRQVSLAFNASGRIEQLFAQEGDAVQKGQILGRLEAGRYEANVKRLEAQVLAQKAVLKALQAGTRPQQIENAKAVMQKSEVVVQNAFQDYQRLQILVERSAVSRQAYEQAETAYKAAQQDLKAAKETLSLAIEGPRPEDIEAAQATLASYEAAAEYASQELKDAMLYAPSDGVIENRLREPGDMAAAGVPVFTIALREPLWIRCYVGEPDLGKIKPGMGAKVLTDSFPDKAYEAKVGYISPTAEFTPKPVETTELRTKLVYQVRVFVQDPNGELRLGMPATVKIQNVVRNTQ